MTEPSEQFRAVMRQRGQSVTGARLAVFKALQNKEPQTMGEVVAACHGQADRASVYRAIALFERLGIAQRLQIGWKYKLELSDPFHNHHHHLTCGNCGKVMPLPEDRILEERLRLLAASARFKMREHQLEIGGLCENCRES